MHGVRSFVHPGPDTALWKAVKEGRSLLPSTIRWYFLSKFPSVVTTSQMYFPSWVISTCCISRAGLQSGVNFHFMLSLQFVLSVLFWSALYPKAQAPPTLGIIFHVTIITFELGGQVSTELLPAVTDTVLIPVGQKGEGCGKRCPGRSLKALEFCSVLHREISARLHSRARTCLCSSADCLSFSITAVDYGASGLFELFTNFPLGLISDVWGRPYSCPLS